MAPGACDFWYLAWGDAAEAYLVDLIRRPDESVVRVGVFRRGEAPRVLRERFASDALVVDADGAGVTLGSWRLDRQRCSGSIEGLALDCRYRRHEPEVALVPAWVGWISPSVPALRSTPGTITEATSPGGARDLPCVYGRYRVGAIERARWFLVSAQSFEGTDARCEISGGWFAGRWALTGYLRLGDDLIPLNHPIANLWRFRAQATGDEAADAGVGSARRFELTYRARQVALRLVAEAPAGAFVELEREGPTTIHTTLFGSCTLEVTVRGRSQTLIARERSLLEVKA